MVTPVDQEYKEEEGIVEKRGGGGVLCNEVNEAGRVYTGVTARCFEAAYKALISGGKSGQMSMVKALLNFSLPPTIPKLPPAPPLSSTMGLSSSESRGLGFLSRTVLISTPSSMEPTLATLDLSRNPLHLLTR